MAIPMIVKPLTACKGALAVMMMKSKILALLMLATALGAASDAVAQGHRNLRDTVTLDKVTVIGKSKTQKLREGALSVNAVDIRSFVNSINNLNTVIDRTAGVKVREEGGVGSDFDLSIKGWCLPGSALMPWAVPSTSSPTVSMPTIWMCRME